NQAADVMGRTGLPGDLDTRFFEKYGSSLLTSAIAAASDWVLGGNSTSVVSPLGGTTQSMSGQARAANRLGNDIDQLGQRMVQENVDIRPVLTVPQGTRLNIIPAEDIWLRDPERLQAVTPARGNMARTVKSNTDLATQLLPGLVEAMAENPALRKLAPQTAQQIMQANVLQQLRDSALGATASGGAGGSSTTPPSANAPTPGGRP
ncbi:MAG TPA: TrbI/VirB10 family protein, partial [Telmatospirillum sp.]|nr:TrbI/VirB10 family protein [Telmatospirillum sp.]